MEKRITTALVEDHELMRQSLELSLAAYPEIDLVGSAPDATSGLNLLLAYKPDVALIDIVLPDKNGIDLTRQYLEFVPDKKVIFLTSSEAEDSIFSAFAAGGSGYCTKQTSIGLDWLVQAIKVVIDGEIWIDPRIAQLILNRANLLNNGKGKQLINQVIIEGEPDYHQILESTPLTEREMEVLQLIVEGKNNSQIAASLYVTVGTVKTHVRNILDKLACNDRTQAAIRALRLGLVN
ncbi:MULTISPECIES: LuxR C-terminal-related transcriptional regulator [unclassified Coleofasciculus]|uniref:LuxR C-terminal-related transcriptional regulator n=1 Tax=unclassified Coleofasciculus TaxID=2692782 RepID=UPI001880F723|nr:MULTISPECIES: response regulator transcription factor [unclassified Coleofasciculus]MBE9124762.1 response regulator transcription factor [Coleofasciculus sp. LEGE 07081]MBE9148214.1 response regulator transcription factor [Coleofasciculus sp. LEGE 07092]